MPKLRSIRLLVDDYPASFRFYRDVMKLVVSYGDEQGPYAEFEAADGVSVALFQKDLMYHLLEEEGGEQTPADSFMLIFKADQTVDDDHQRLASGARTVIGPTDREAWGLRAAQYRDPQGVLIEINKGFDE
jgi:catechol 2,3-dioxygenase-like lactoylglutathione lyase family enzyme